MDFGLTFSVETMTILLKVIAIDLVLSGDNAVVIAMATRRLPEKQRNRAIYWGTAFAIILRIAFAVIVVQLLQIPLIHFFGGLLLLYIAYKVLLDEEEEQHNVKVKNSLMGAIYTILIADVVMSLDNVIAVAGASKGNVIILAIGVLVSIPIMIFGSKIILHYMNKYPWIAYIGSGILAWTACEMIIGDELMMSWVNLEPGLLTLLLTITITSLVLFVGYWQNKRLVPARQSTVQVRKNNK